MAKGDAFLDLIPLAEAVICEDCEVISRAKHSTCPSCGSTAIYNLERIIHRLSQPEIDRVIENLWKRS